MHIGLGGQELSPDFKDKLTWVPTLALRGMIRRGHSSPAGWRSSPCQGKACQGARGAARLRGFYPLHPVLGKRREAQPPEPRAPRGWQLKNQLMLRAPSSQSSATLRGKSLPGLSQNLELPKLNRWLHTFPAHVVCSASGEVTVAINTSSVVFFN